MREVSGYQVGASPAKTGRSALGRARGRVLGWAAERAALEVLFPAHVPVGPAVAPVELLLGALDDHRVAEMGDAVQPLGVLVGDVDAAVRDVAVALVRDRPRRGVDVLPVPGEALRPVHLRAVPARRLRRDAD